LRQDAAGTIWVGTLGGLDRLDPQTNGFTHYRHDPNDPTSLSSDAVSTIFEDSRGALWIGTGGLSVAGAGLNQFDRVTGKFTRYMHDPANAQSIAGNNISAIVEAPVGALWIGTGGFSVEGAGLDLLNPRTGVFTHFQHDEAKPDSLSADNVMDLVIDADALWVSTYGSGLNRMELAAPGQFTHYRNNPYFAESLSGDETWALLKDRSGMLWIGTARNGINQLPVNTGQFNLYRHIPDNTNSLAADAVGAFDEDAQGRIWLAMWASGLDRFDPRTGQFDHIVAKPEDSTALASNLVLAVQRRRSGPGLGGDAGRRLESLRSGCRQSYALST
jgi:ligand-binding sensor domain-containing protein